MLKYNGWGRVNKEAMTGRLIRFGLQTIVAIYDPKTTPNATSKIGFARKIHAKKRGLDELWGLRMSVARILMMVQSVLQ